MNSVPELPVLDRVILAHGGGGELMARLIRRHLLGPLRNDALAALTDGAVLPPIDGELVFTTDSYVVTPIEFPGGDIGRLAVAGTVNDLAVMGATPLALSLGLILEEGLPLATLDRIVATIARTAAEAGVHVVTGDTKVIEHRATGGLPASSGSARPAHEGLGVPPLADGQMFINTAGVGRRRPGLRLGVDRVTPGDVVLVNGTLADHGLAVLSVRAGIAFESPLRSDAAPLAGLIGRVLDAGVDVKFMRDATRGGLAGVLCDVSEGAGVTIEVEERRLPVTPTARHAAELLGLDPLTVANEGKCVFVVAHQHVDQALRVLRDHPLGREASRIGEVTAAQPPLVELLTPAGGRRVVQRPYGEDLPRIC
ncbi:MAG: hydrogenase expression/formation protein HypE [Phycisphaerales bacterium]|nr:hydrogenase expression/formation protein HypE [Phycisphaerales bacterium]